MSDIVIELEEPWQIKVWAGNWLCTYAIRNNRVVRLSELSRYRQHPSARPDELIEQADKLAREWFAAQRGKEKVWERKSHASGDGRCSS